MSQQMVNALDQAYRSVSRMQWVNHYVFGADIPVLLPPPTGSPAPQAMPHATALPTAQIASSPVARAAALHAATKPTKTIAFHGTLPAPGLAPGLDSRGLIPGL